MNVAENSGCVLLLQTILVSSELENNLEKSAIRG